MLCLKFQWCFIIGQLAVCHVLTKCKKLADPAMQFIILQIHAAYNTANPCSLGHLSRWCIKGVCHLYNFRCLGVRCVCVCVCLSHLSDSRSWCSLHLQLVIRWQNPVQKQPLVPKPSTCVDLRGLDKYKKCGTKSSQPIRGQGKATAILLTPRLIIDLGRRN